MTFCVNAPVDKVNPFPHTFPRCTNQWDLTCDFIYLVYMAGCHSHPFEISCSWNSGVISYYWSSVEIILGWNQRKPSLFACNRWKNSVDKRRWNVICLKIRSLSCAFLKSVLDFLLIFILLILFSCFIFQSKFKPVMIFCLMYFSFSPKAHVQRLLHSVPSCSCCCNLSFGIIGLSVTLNIFLSSARDASIFERCHE